MNNTIIVLICVFSIVLILLYMSFERKKNEEVKRQIEEYKKESGSGGLNAWDLIEGIVNKKP